MQHQSNIIFQKEILHQEFIALRFVT